MGDHGMLVKVRVVHDFYGCDSGCCGHKAIAEDATGNECKGSLEFYHPGEGQSDRDFAAEFASEDFAGIPLDFEECEIRSD